VARGSYAAAESVVAGSVHLFLSGFARIFFVQEIVQVDL
jgi:hypothetical protein